MLEDYNDLHCAQMMASDQAMMTVSSYGHDLSVSNNAHVLYLIFTRYQVSLMMITKKSNFFPILYRVVFSVAITLATSSYKLSMFAGPDWPGIDMILATPF